jgi:DNA-binding transcriptional LysR family regulator
MDRIDAMEVFVAALDEGSLADASRRLKRSPTAVSRALAFLEAHVGVELLHRTTRSIKLSEAGERYAAACRRVLIELEEADMLAAGERSAPLGILTISAPPISGEEIPSQLRRSPERRYHLSSADLRRGDIAADRGRFPRPPSGRFGPAPPPGPAHQPDR